MGISGMRTSTIMKQKPVQSHDAEIRALIKPIVAAPDPKIKRIVATVDALTQRGPVDLLIDPVRQRLARIRPPRPLRFGRLMFYPLDLLILPAARWTQGQQAIPRTALMPMVHHVSLAMGTEAAAVKAEIAHRTTADVALISRLGQSLWPAAAAILADSGIPKGWASTQLGEATYRPLADAVAALLAEAATLDQLRAEAATGSLPPRPDVVEAILGRVARANKSALPMMIAMLLDCLPLAAALLPAAKKGPEAAALHAAMDEATDLLLQQLDQENITDMRIATGTLAEAGAAVGGIAALLKNLDKAGAKPQRREQIRAVRQRLDADCKARFAWGLQDELLAPLQDPGIAGSIDIPALEVAARGLRVLETEGRLVGSGAAYDRLLAGAAETIKGNAVLDRLSQVDQIRLVEILCGPEAALAMLTPRPARQAGSPSPSSASVDAPRNVQTSRRL